MPLLATLVTYTSTNPRIYPLHRSSYIPHIYTHPALLSTPYPRPSLIPPPHHSFPLYLPYTTLSPSTSPSPPTLFSPTSPLSIGRHGGGTSRPASRNTRTDHPAPLGRAHRSRGVVSKATSCQCNKLSLMYFIHSFTYRYIPSQSPSRTP